MTRTEKVAGLLLTEAREAKGLSWQTAWALEDFFGVKPESSWTLRKALDNCIDLTREQYEALHDGREVPGLVYAPRAEFMITHVGANYEASFQDLGIEYYKYVS